MTGRRTPDGLIATSIDSASGWFRAAGLAKGAATLGLVTELYAIASLLSSEFHRAGWAAGRTWMLVGGSGVALQMSLTGVAAYLAARGAGVAERELRAGLTHTLFRPGAPVVSSAVASRLMVEDARNVADAAARWEPLRVEVSVVPAILVAFAFATNWLVGAFLLLAAPFIPINMAVFGMGAERLSEQQSAQVAALDELVLDRVKGADTLRALGASERERGTVGAAADELGRRTMTVLRVALGSSAALEAIVTYAMAVAATYIGLVLLDYVHISWAPTSLTYRGGVFLLLLAPAFFQPFRDLAAAYHDHKDVEAATETLRRHLSAAPDPGAVAVAATEPPRPLAASSTAAHGQYAVAACGLRFRYPDSSADTVTDLDWSVPDGSLAGIAGASGVGKTTLLRLVTGRLQPTGGRLERGTGRIAWVGQRPYFFQSSIAENLRIARPDASTAALWDALNSVGLAEVVAAIPSGLDTELSWTGGALSGGQGRRLALARALLSGADTLVLDEPTAHLDPDSEASVIETIIGLTPGTTVIIASHSKALLAACSQVLDLQVGREVRMADAP